uniref:NAD(+) diphosphatase n=1 Tax=Eutreptiella gymnastica TaxID=73025 RepID=A0A7S4FQ04_9EUGL
MAAWSAAVPHCPRCGGRTAPFRLGTMRKCTSCGAEQRPRIDPSVIMLVADSDRCLLGRKAEWKEGRYSALAGFVELGESLEEAVLREVQEESGVVVDLNTLQYHSTQPWLFPRSLMVGFLVQPHPLSPPVTVDMDELEDVRWFDKASVRNCLQGLPRVPGSDLPQGFHLPTPATLAHALISSWALEK